MLSGSRKYYSVQAITSTCQEVEGHFAINYNAATKERGHHHTHSPTRTPASPVLTDET